LNILCGFGAEEIAAAFLTNKEVIYKRLSRAKDKLKTQKILIAMPPLAEIPPRLENVLTAMYLLFSEGYYSSLGDVMLRKDCCLEAMRLTFLLTENAATNTPAVNALLSLMCFHASRFEARLNHKGEMILYEDQDTALWNQELIVRGTYFLNLSSKGDQLSRYHLEAAIAYWHTNKGDAVSKWENILQLYNKLLQKAYSPVAALNRTYALFKANGKEEAIEEAKKLQLEGNHLYHLLMGELYRGSDQRQALIHLETAWQLSKSTPEKNNIALKIEQCKGELARR
jgi:predicted RNA polymerase sigma factor